MALVLTPVFDAVWTATAPIQYVGIAGAATNLPA
jgi:hypothetical protein